MLRFIRLAALVVLLGTVYSRFVRTPILNWGATKEAAAAAAAAAAAFPGDELLEIGLLVGATIETLRSDRRKST